MGTGRGDAAAATWISRGDERRRGRDVEAATPPDDPGWSRTFDCETGARLPGDLGFDPLGLKPKTEKDLKSMQTKEINNGRLAMIGIAGMVAQELVSGMKI